MGKEFQILAVQEETLDIDILITSRNGDKKCSFHKKTCSFHKIIEPIEGH